jgi:AcrR family transcriptional regulator
MALKKVTAEGKRRKFTTPRRIGAKQSAKRAILLDATEKLMLKEGYAAVSTRRVAQEVGLTPALIHYYFPTTDDLFVAVYRRAVERTRDGFKAAMASDQPLRAYWELQTDPVCTPLAIELMALANHRKVMRKEIGRYSDAFRKLQADALVALGVDGGQMKCSPLGLTVLIAGISRILVMEGSLGMTAGHKDLKAFVEHWLGQFEGKKSSKSRPKTRPKARGRA